MQASLINETVLIKLNKATIENGDADLLLKEINEYLSSQPKREFIKYQLRLKSFLAEQGKKQTPERYKILEKIINEPQPFKMVDIHHRVSKDMHVSFATISNTVRLFEEANILKQVGESQIFKYTYFEVI